MGILLQVTDTVHSLTQSGLEPQTSEKINLWSLLNKGGWLMYPLYFFICRCHLCFFERLIAIKKASRIDNNFMNMVRDNIMTGNISAARNLARNTSNPVARIIDKGLQRIGKPIDAIEKSMENVGKLEMYKMEKKHQYTFHHCRHGA